MDLKGRDFLKLLDYKSEEIERIASKLYDYHKASLEDKAYYQKHKNKY